MARHLITSALPYINGIKHLGNLVDSMLPSDAYARYLRLRRHEVLHICATDEHGMLAENAATKAGLPVAEYCTLMHHIQKELCGRFHLDFDWFGRSSRLPNHQLTQHFADRLATNGLIHEVGTTQFYSPTDGHFLPDWLVEGTCPNCEYPHARGNQCKNCTNPLDPTNLITPRSAISGATDLKSHKIRHLCLMQSQMRNELCAWINSKTDWPKLARAIALKWLNDSNGLQDRSITCNLDWGVPVRRGNKCWPGMEGRVFHAWFDAPITYMGATVEWAEATGSDWQCWWREDKGAKNVRYIQFMTKDHIPLYTLSFPATIMGTGEPWKQVDHIKVLNRMTFDGGNFSISQERGVFMNQALEILPADCWRWWLLSHAPESEDSDFTWESLRDSINNDLADVLGNFINRTTNFVVNRYDSRLPEGGENGPLEAELATETETRLRAYEVAMEAIEFRRATAELRALWAIGNEYLHRAEPWAQITTNPDRAATSLRMAFNLIRLQAIVSAPFLPDTSARILAALNLPAAISGDWPEDVSDAINTLPSGHPIKPLESLFSKITDENIETWRAHFSGETSMLFPPDWGNDTLSNHMGKTIHNARATFIRIKFQYERLASIDHSFSIICNNLSNQPAPWPSHLLMVRAHCGYKAACQLIISGQITESVPILRALCLECALYALRISKSKNAREAWLNRGTDKKSKQAVRKEFARPKWECTLKSVDQELLENVQELYDRCIDSGAHPNPMAVALNLKIAENHKEFKFDAKTLHGDPAIVATGMKFAEKIGWASLSIFKNIFPECFKIHEIDIALEELRPNSTS